MGLDAVLRSTDATVYRASYCGSDVLTTPDSIVRGMGPTCAKRAGRRRW